jgi:hypothetical protein
VTGRARGILVLAAAVAVVGGAGVWLARSRSDGVCGREVHEPLDARSLQHVLPSAPAPAFDSAAPTSGPHAVLELNLALEGAELDRTLPGAEQVGLLERGNVLVQHRDRVSPPRLRPLLAKGVAVAPNPALDAPIVVTAWQVRLRCDGVDVPRLRRFVAAHGGGGPGTP